MTFSINKQIFKFYAKINSFYIITHYLLGMLAKIYKVIVFII
jgi:hypothetical protein